ncbi:hypothetical protein AYJ00_06425 [Shewanella algae]|nr:hypothetical protein AYJ00_06425 [Shewanella algae]
MPKQRQSNQGRVSLSDKLTSARQDVKLDKSHMDVTPSSGAIANWHHKHKGVSAASRVAGGLERGLVDTAPFPRVWGEVPRL